jgi:hypothetical protein
VFFGAFSNLNIREYPAVSFKTLANPGKNRPINHDIFYFASEQGVYACRAAVGSRVGRRLVFT